MWYVLSYSLAAFAAFWVSLFCYHLMNAKRRREGQSEQDNIVAGSVLIGLFWPLVVPLSLIVLASQLFAVSDKALRAAAVRVAGGGVSVPDDRGLHVGQKQGLPGLVRCTHSLLPTARYCPRCGTSAAQHRAETPARRGRVGRRKVEPQR